MKDKTTTISIVAVAVIGIGILFYFGITGDQVKPAPDAISRNGLHWHSNLSIVVKGEKVEIPANVGLGAVHNPIHTHDEDAPDGVIHMEFGGLVRADDLKLDRFFQVWQKDINSFGTNMKMTVNGIDNTEFGDYNMQDGDKIELMYE